MLSELLGCWKFKGTQMTDVEGHSLPDPLNQASGLLIHSSKYMAVQLYLPKDSNLSEHVGMQVDISYYETYDFDRSSQIVTHYVESSNIGDMVGKSLPRKVKKINEATIALANTEPEQFGIGIMIFRKLIWEKTDDVKIIAVEKIKP